jgi:hypothetical protein
VAQDNARRRPGPTPETIRSRKCSTPSHRRFARLLCLLTPCRVSQGHLRCTGPSAQTQSTLG